MDGSANPKEQLLRAIRDYANHAQHLPSAGQLVEQLRSIEQDIHRLPNPVSQGAGSLPPQHPGSSEAGSNDPAPAGNGHAPAGAAVEIHIHSDGPAFPSKDSVKDFIHRRKVAA